MFWPFFKEWNAAQDQTIFSHLYNSVNSQTWWVFLLCFWLFYSRTEFVAWCHWHRSSWGLSSWHKVMIKILPSFVSFVHSPVFQFYRKWSFLFVKILFYCQLSSCSSLLQTVITAASLGTYRQVMNLPCSMCQTLEWDSLTFGISQYVIFSQRCWNTDDTLISDLLPHRLLCTGPPPSL